MLRLRLRSEEECWPHHPVFLVGSLATFLFFSAPVSPAAAQQYVVDDAEIVDRGACHVEAWHGERASWLLPACQPVRNLEIAVGVGFVDEGDGRRETEYAIEAKTLFRPLAPGDWGAGLVLGVGPNPSAEPGERHFGDLYAFVPASLSIADDQLIVHGNVGWEWQRESAEASDEHFLTWGVRGDVALHELLSFIGELHSEDDHRPACQVGVRIHQPEAGVEVDLSWGGHTDGNRHGAGFTVGLAFVSGRIF